MTTLNYNGIIRGTVIRSMQVLGYGANPDPTPPGPTPLQVSASVRFNTADTAGITFMPQLQGSRTTWTWSGWIKRSSLGVAQYLMSVYNAPSNYTFQFQLMADNTLEVFDYNAGGAGSYLWRVKTTQVFRDPSSWYHIQISIDTTQATAANRVSIYVNGVLITALAVATYPSQYFLTNINVPYTHYIGSYVGSTTWLGAYLADINFVDGQALTPSSFTETDTATGQIIPMTYAGSYGTNGFYLPFGNSATVTELGLNPKATGQDYPYWPYNTLLINSSSANSAQNNTFLDSSTNAFTITRNGNTTQGNFTPFIEQRVRHRIYWSGVGRVEVVFDAYGQELR